MDFSKVFDQVRHYLFLLLQLRDCALGEEKTWLEGFLFNGVTCE
jgi:hypothetical protein